MEKFLVVSMLALGLAKTLDEARRSYATVLARARARAQRKQRAKLLALQGRAAPRERAPGGDSQ